MRKHIYIFFGGLLSINLMATNLKVSDKNVHARPDLGRVKLFHSNKDGFKVWRDGKMEKISSDNLSAELRSINTKTLKKYQKDAYIKLGKNSEGEVTASSHVRAKAGGPLLGEALYWGVKGGCYWALSAASQIVVDNVTGIKSGNGYIVPRGPHPINESISEGGLKGAGAWASKHLATTAPRLMGIHAGATAAKMSYSLFSPAAWEHMHSLNPAYNPSKDLIGYQNLAPSAGSPFARSAQQATPLITYKTVGQFSGSAAAGHTLYKEGFMGDVGRSQWNLGMNTIIKNSHNYFADSASTGAIVVLGAGATQGAATTGVIGCIEALAQTARAWGYAQPCP